jgi:hypothetical protein
MTNKFRLNKKHALPFVTQAENRLIYFEKFEYPTNKSISPFGICKLVNLVGQIFKKVLANSDWCQYLANGYKKGGLDADISLNGYLNCFVSKLPTKSPILNKTSGTKTQGSWH